MTRKPTEIVQISLRVREALRRRLEASAKKRGVSLNFEMASRLEQSFEDETLTDLRTVADEIKEHWLRLSRS